MIVEGATGWPLPRPLRRRRRQLRGLSIPENNEHSDQFRRTLSVGGLGIDHPKTCHRRQERSHTARRSNADRETACHCASVRTRVGQAEALPANGHRNNLHVLCAVARSSGRIADPRTVAAGSGGAPGSGTRGRSSLEEPVATRDASAPLMAGEPECRDSGSQMAPGARSRRSPPDAGTEELRTWERVVTDGLRRVEEKDEGGATQTSLGLRVAGSDSPVLI
jgi:hypothetical protein